MQRFALPLLLVAAFPVLVLAQTKATKEGETVEQIWKRMEWEQTDSELQCRDRLRGEDPTIEWKRWEPEKKGELYVVTAYGTRNMQMVTGVCHVTSKNDKRKVVKTWIK